jgi:hypothetical protein
MLDLRYREDRKVGRTILDRSIISTDTKSTSFLVRGLKDILTSKALV